MTEINRTSLNAVPKASDRIIDGLFAGIIAGVVMAAYLLLVGLILGDSPVESLLRFALNEGDSPLIGGLFHLAVSAVYGAAFGLGYYLLARFWRGWQSIWSGIALGAFYGLVLYALARMILLPGTNSALSEIPALHFAFAHLVFGICLGVILGREDNRQNPR